MSSWEGLHPGIDEGTERSAGALVRPVLCFAGRELVSDTGHGSSNCPAKNGSIKATHEPNGCRGIGLKRHGNQAPKGRTSNQKHKARATHNSRNTEPTTATQEPE